MVAPRVHVAGAIIMAFLLQGMAAHYSSAQVSPPPKDDSVSDTDAAVFDMIFGNAAGTDTLTFDMIFGNAAGTDTLTFDMIFGNAGERADTTDTTAFRRANFYLPSTQPDRRMASPVQRARRPFFPALGNYWRHEVELDSTRQEFIVREFVGESEVRYPLVIDFETYQQRRLNAWLSDNWRIISEQQAQRRRQRTRGGMGFDIAIPGGRGKRLQYYIRRKHREPSRKRAGQYSGRLRLS